MRKLYFVIIIFSVLFCLSLISCVGTSQITSDPPLNKKITTAAREYLYGCPGYYFPPLVFNNTGAIKSSHGAVAYNISIDPQIPETKKTFISKLSKATDPINTVSYQTYLKSDGAGFPGYTIGGTEYPERKYQAGFVCYGLAYRIITDAGWSISIPLSVGGLLKDRIEVGSNENAMVGDIVAYDFDNDGVFEHVGILTNINGNSKKEWKAISSVGIIEIFQYGAAEKRVGVFGDRSVGGEFSVWEPGWNNYTIKIFKL